MTKNNVQPRDKQVRAYKCVCHFSPRFTNKKNRLTIKSSSVHFPWCCSWRHECACHRSPWWTTACGRWTWRTEQEGCLPRMTSQGSPPDDHDIKRSKPKWRASNKKEMKQNVVSTRSIYVRGSIERYHQEVCFLRTTTTNKNKKSYYYKISLYIRIYFRYWVSMTRWKGYLLSQKYAHGIACGKTEKTEKKAQKGPNKNRTQWGKFKNWK